jgi:hypothetical protein
MLHSAYARAHLQASLAHGHATRLAAVALQRQAKPATRRSPTRVTQSASGSMS